MYPGAPRRTACRAREGVGPALRWFLRRLRSERINPGDKGIACRSKGHLGSTAEVAGWSILYRQIIVAGTHKAPSIRVAEAARSSRAPASSLMNSSRCSLPARHDTLAVLEAAGTKWTPPFRPGPSGRALHRRRSLPNRQGREGGLHPQVILAGRRVNDMGRYVAHHDQKMVQRHRRHSRHGWRARPDLQENCPDIRNSKVIDIIREFRTSASMSLRKTLMRSGRTCHEYPGVEIAPGGSG